MNYRKPNRALENQQRNISELCSPLEPPKKNMQVQRTPKIPVELLGGGVKFFSNIKNQISYCTLNNHTNVPGLNSGLQNLYNYVFMSF